MIFNSKFLMWIATYRTSHFVLGRKDLGWLLTGLQRDTTGEDGTDFRTAGYSCGGLKPLSGRWIAMPVYDDSSCNWKIGNMEVQNSRGMGGHHLLHFSGMAVGQSRLRRSR